MSDSYSRICFLLASAGFREKELADFALTVKEAGISIFVEDVYSKRTLILSDGRTSKGEGDYRQLRFRPQDDTLETKVTQLLVHEAKMTKFEASEALRMELEEKGTLLELPSLGKRGFGEWLRVLARLVPPSEILHLCTRIRNRYVHQSDTDWSLK